MDTRNQGDSTKVVCIDNENLNAILCEFKAMLSAHREMLTNQYRFLVDIHLSKVSKDEIAEYLVDAMGFDPSHYNNFITDYLPILLQSILGKIKKFSQLENILKCENNNVVISTLYLLCDSELAYAKLSRRIAKSSDIFVKDKMQTISGGVTFLTSALSFLRPCLPVSHNKLTEIIYFKEIENKNKTSRAKGPIQASYSVNWEVNWRKASMQLTNDCKAFSKLISNKKVIENETKKAVIEFKESIDMALAKLVIKISKAKNTDAVSEDEIFKCIFENVLYYYEEINPLLEKANESILFLKNEELAAQALNKLCCSAKQELEAKVNSNRRLADFLNRRLESVYTKEKWKEYQEPITTILQSIDEIKMEINTILDPWTAHMTSEWSTERIEDELSKSKDKSDCIKKRLVVIQDKFITMSENLEAAQSVSIGNEPSTPQPLFLKNNERELFINECKKINNERKEIIQKLRKERQLEKSIAALPKQAVDVIPGPVITIYKNMEVEECLLQMSDKYFELLQNIFSYKKGILFSDICNLIINQLGGSIEELGSSHKRIRINKYLMEMVTHSSEINTRKEKIKNTDSLPSVVTGGFFRPHGEAHQSGMMSRFNLKLVTNIFIQAGITMEVLHLMEVKRLSIRQRPCSNSVKF